MATLWTFGDSLTEGYNIKYEWSKSYIDWKGYTPKVHGEVISEKLNLDLRNLGLGGSDNYSIFQNFCDVSNKIKEDDIVIFGWSSPMRFRLVGNHNTWKTFIPNYTKNLSDINGISINTINELLIHRDNVKFVEEVNSWITLIDNFLVNVNHVHWTIFDDRIKAHMIRGLNTIKNETNGDVDDGHFSEEGQFQLSEKLIHLLSIKNKNTLI
jgi:hypothetical protein